MSQSQWTAVGNVLDLGWRRVLDATGALLGAACLVLSFREGSFRESALCGSAVRLGYDVSTARSRALVNRGYFATIGQSLASSPASTRLAPPRLRDDGSQRRNNPRRDRGWTHRHRSLRARQHPAGERRRALRPHVPRLPQRPSPVHRRAQADGRSDRAASRSRATSRSSFTRANSCSARRSNASTIPNDLVARLEGKSSLGRLGLLIHSTAGFIDSGFTGNITLELSNVANLPITIYHGHADRADLVHAPGRPVEKPYGSGELTSKYQGQAEPTPSSYHLNFAK